MSKKCMTRSDFMRAVGLFVFGMVILGYTSIQTAVANNEKPEKPNIILFLTDDQGWTDTSVQMDKNRPDSKSTLYRTPALEKMATEGMVFSNAYAPAPTCTPTRTSLQFGKTPARLRNTIVNDVLAKYRNIRCQDEIALPQMIKSVDPDYITAHFGKWGMDVRKPEEAGYDVTDGNTNNGEGDWLVHRKVPLPKDDPKRIFSVTERANRFMGQQVRDGRPFFMQVSHYALHVDHQALEKTIEKYRRLPAIRNNKPLNVPIGKMDHNILNPSEEAVALYAAMIENLDTGLGLLLEKVEDLGIKKNTYIIFTSDNGGGFQGNAPLKGGKANLWEGGIRVPTVVCGPDVPQGKYCNTPVAGWDIYATVNEIIGGKPLPDEYDGGSWCGLFRKGDKGSIERGTPELIFHFPWYANTPMAVIRDGDFKLIKNLLTQEVRLYNLEKDIGETRNLASSMPARADRLHQKMQEYLNAVNAEDIYDMLDARRRQIREQIKHEKEKTKPDQDRLDMYHQWLNRVDEVENNKEW